MVNKQSVLSYSNNYLIIGRNKFLFPTSVFYRIIERSPAKQI